MNALGTLVAKQLESLACWQTVKSRNRTVRFLWFGLGLSLGILVTINVQWPLKSEPPLKTEAAPAQIFLNTDVNKLMSIRNPNEATQKRAELVNFIWGPDGLPKEQPARVDKAIQDNRYSDLNNLKQIDKLIVKMEWDMTSTVYHFIPSQSNGKLLIYHGGHDGDFIVAREVIERFLKNGFGVLALSMPLEPPNNRPVVDLDGIGKIQLAFHDQLKFLKMKSGHPVQLFFTPITVSLNYAQSLGYSSVYLAGLSGGGWTTTMYAALDLRITRSYPVAGTLPLHLREDRMRFNSAQRSVDWGDYEQTIPELHSIVNYLDLYVLSSLGERRKQLQILNQDDPICFAGESFRTYEGAVNDRVKALGGGTFAVFLDTENTQHSISRNAVDAILNDINTN